MTRQSIVACVLLAAACALGCSPSEPPSPVQGTVAPPPLEEARQSGQQGLAGKIQVEIPPADTPRRLVRKVELDLTVTDPTAKADSLGKLATSMGGHIASMLSERRNELMFYRITLRVPEKRLDEAVRAIKALARSVDRENITSEDVTDRYVDLEARLKTLEATEGELRALLAESRQRQQKAEDIMAIYRELTGIRSQIEQIRGQRNVLENLSNLATIEVALSPVQSSAPVVSGTWHPLETLRNSFRALVSVLTGLADFLIMFLVVVVPPVAIATLAVVLGLKAVRVLRRARQT